MKGIVKVYSASKGYVHNGYDVVISWSPADHRYIVSVPDLPGCMADGLTEEEALSNAEQIIREWIETARFLGRL